MNESLPCHGTILSSIVTTEPGMYTDENLALNKSKSDFNLNSLSWLEFLLSLFVKMPKLEEQFEPLSRHRVSKDLRSVQLAATPVVAQFWHLHQPHLGNDFKKLEHLLTRGWFSLTKFGLTDNSMNLKVLLRISISFTSYKIDNFVRDELPIRVNAIDCIIFREKSYFFNESMVLYKLCI